MPRPRSSRHLANILCRPLIILLLAPGELPSIAQRRAQTVLVRQVVDGDTIDIAGAGRIGLLGIDAPELRRPAAMAPSVAREARERLEGLVINRWVRLEYDSAGARGSAYVFLEDGRFVNEWLVHEGLARVVPRRGLRRLHELQTAEAAAQAARRGIWRSGVP
jgi:endonuclease YncB( thermonuclease family)